MEEVHGRNMLSLLAVVDYNSFTVIASSTHILTVKFRIPDDDPEHFFYKFVAFVAPQQILWGSPQSSTQFFGESPQIIPISKRGAPKWRILLLLMDRVECLSTGLLSQSLMKG